MRAILYGGGISLLISLLGTRFAINGPDQARLRPGDPRGRADHPPHQARDAHDGRDRHHPGDVGGLLRRQPAHQRLDQRLGAAPAVPVHRARSRRLPRRLHQDRQAAQPRAAQCHEDDRADRDRARLRHPRAVALAGGREPPSARLAPPLVPQGHRLGAPDRPGAAADLVLRHRLQQRRQPHRRPRRPGDGCVRDGLRRLRAGEHLAEQPVLRVAAQPELLRGPRSAGPGDRVGRDHGRLLRLPVVERLAGRDLHGRHRLARARGCPGRVWRS